MGGGASIPADERSPKAKLAGKSQHYDIRTSVKSDSNGTVIDQTVFDTGKLATRAHDTSDIVASRTGSNTSAIARPTSSLHAATPAVRSGHSVSQRPASSLPTASSPSSTQSAAAPAAVPARHTRRPASPGPPGLSRARSKSHSPVRRSASPKTGGVPRTSSQALEEKKKPLTVVDSQNEKPSKWELDKDRVLHSWCSWCFKRTLHGRAEHNILRRNVYKCQNCIKRTLQCRWCREMARGHMDWDDELCAKCDGSIKDWSHVPDGFRQLGWCSWCFKLTNHDRQITNIVRRDGYKCDACGGNTAVCMKCDRAFTRCTSFYDDKLCARCDGTIQTWENYKFNREYAIKIGLDVLVKNDPYLSYAPPRRNVKCIAHIDGASFYTAAIASMEKAQESIYMSFWHVNDKIYLRRMKDVPLHDDDRLDNVVRAAAERGVKVHILLWRENATFVADNFSAEMKTAFESLHPNVMVIRHGHPTPWSCHWSHHQKFIVIDQAHCYVGGLDICMGRFDTQEHVLTDEKAEMWRGKDYYNPHLVRPDNIDNFEEDVLDRTKIPRMPWHDIQIELKGLVARDIARNFVQRWNHHKTVQYADHKLPLLHLKENITKNMDRGTCKVQAVRSLDRWSGGVRNERSIYGAYIRAIQAAEHFVYIENQYFTSALAGGGIENKVGVYLLEKIREKIKAKATFRVIVMLPHPEEQGGTADSILHWQYLTIQRGGSSIMEQLIAEFPGVDLEEYISFMFLRQYAYLGGRPVTEKVFVHAKTMIVDDRIVITGSANLNDRSFLGDRDSEIGVVIEDEDTVEITFNGQPVEVGKFPHRLRMRLWQEHLGLTDVELPSVVDAVCDDTYNGIWLATARKNTQVYEQVFPAIPRDLYRTMKDYEEAGGTSLPHKCVDDRKLWILLEEVRGVLCMHPMRFLEEHELGADIITGKVAPWTTQ